jgi:hypothetical protein
VSADAIERNANGETQERLVAEARRAGLQNRDRFRTAGLCQHLNGRRADVHLTFTVQQITKKAVGLRSLQAAGNLTN